MSRGYRFRPRQDNGDFDEAWNTLVVFEGAGRNWQPYDQGSYRLENGQREARGVGGSHRDEAWLIPSKSRVVTVLYSGDDDMEYILLIKKYGNKVIRIPTYWGSEDEGYGDCLEGYHTRFLLEPGEYFQGGSPLEKGLAEQLRKLGATVEAQLAPDWVGTWCSERVMGYVWEVFIPYGKEDLLEKLRKYRRLS